MHYRHGTVSLTSSKQQYGTVSRFQSALGTVPWLQDFKFLGELDWPVLTDRRREARLSLFSKATGGHSAISLMQSISAYESNTPRWSLKFHPHLCTNWCLQIFVLSTYTSRLEHSVCWSPSQVLVVCKRVSWFSRLSHDTRSSGKG